MANQPTRSTPATARVAHAPAVTRTSRRTEPSSPPEPPPPGPDLATPDSPAYRWEYQWEDGVSGVGERAVDPPLDLRLAQEVLRAVQTPGSPPTLILVRGELGIGKSELVKLLQEQLYRLAVSVSNATHRNSLYGCSVLEAEDLETPLAFAGRVKEASESSTSVVALARPETLDVAALWIDRAATATVTMRPFEPNRPLFAECLAHICNRANLHNNKQRRQVETLAKRLPRVLQTPFYFHELANVVCSAGDGLGTTDRSPLEWFRTSLDVRIGDGAFDDLLAVATGRNAPEDIRAIPGIIDEQGFRHDGYRNVVLAVAVLTGPETFESITRSANSLPAVQVVLDHIQHIWRRTRKLNFQDPILSQLRSYVVTLTSENCDVPYLVYFQGLVARSLLALGEQQVAESLRQRCLEIVETRSTSSDPGKDAHDEPSKWWDVSDALSAIGDPRLRTAERQNYGISSGYFTEISSCDVEIGSEWIPKREDDAKPVLPFSRTQVAVGPFWVSNYLVTNEQYVAFWSSRDRAEYFEGTGKQWYQQDPTLMDRIAKSFDVVAPRCYWLDVQESHRVAALAGDISVLEIARLSALRSDRVRLWDPTLVDQRFSARGNPVVGINWWEAMAFCRWWSEVMLPASDFPKGSHASLLTDWEWEAVRRIYYDPSLEDADSYAEVRYPAHLRRIAKANERVPNVMRPLHVGLSPVPNGPGPFDMIGNVWEFTRSRVFSQIRPGPPGGADPYRNTIWDDVDPKLEREPLAVGRDSTDVPYDLGYRALRGSSFFCIDSQAAWNPAYRICDPPFTSYFDLGFRIAVYPPRT